MSRQALKTTLRAISWFAIGITVLLTVRYVARAPLGEGPLWVAMVGLFVFIWQPVMMVNLLFTETNKFRWPKKSTPEDKELAVDLMKFIIVVGLSMTIVRVLLHY